MNGSNYWFPAKLYGWGWGFPSSWQGWVVFIGYLILMVAGIFLIDSETNLAGFLLYAVLLTAALVAIAWWKGEPTRWRWGK